MTMTTRERGCDWTISFLIQDNGPDAARVSGHAATPVRIPIASHIVSACDNPPKLPQSQIAERLRPCLVTGRLEGLYAMF
jgi:hypothetical protein